LPEQPQPRPAESDLTLALDLAQMVADKQATDILILDISKPLGIADYFVIATARSGRQAQAIARDVDLTMKHRGVLRRNMAGLEGDSGWVLLDFNTVVVHVFSAQAREFYGLENLWADVPRVGFTPAEKPLVQDDSWMSDSEESFPDSIGNL
jgi:ribosome-associated protein